jgi:ferredoxin
LKNKRKKGNKKILKNAKTIDIYFFTGTGNTYLCAKKIAETFEKKDCIVYLKDIAKSNPSEIDFSNTIGIGFPVACWNTFPLVKSFIKNLPKSENETEIFVFATMGDSSLHCVQNFANVLKKKGYRIIGAQSFIMPNNFLLVKNKEKNAVKREKAFKRAEKFAKQIYDGTAKPAKTNLFFKLCFTITSFITNLWSGILFQKIVKFSILKEACSKCGLCVKICPVNNIVIKELPSFHSFKELPSFDGKKCQFCLRCISYCPKQAIKSLFVRKTYRALNNAEVFTK